MEDVLKEATRVAAQVEFVQEQAKEKAKKSLQLAEEMQTRAEEDKKAALKAAEEALKRAQEAAEQAKNEIVAQAATKISVAEEQKELAESQLKKAANFKANFEKMFD